MAYADEVALDSPRHWWRINEPYGPVFDDSGAVRSLGLAAAAAYPGARGICTDGKSCPIYSAMQRIMTTETVAGFTTPWTIEAWVWFMGATGASQALAYWTAGSGGLALAVDSALKPNLTRLNGASGQAISSAAALSKFAWHHVVGTHDGSNMNLYADSVLVAGPTVSSAATSPTSAFAIGNQVTATAQVANGFMTEVALYNTALSAARVLAHYNAANLKAFSPAYSIPATSDAVAALEVEVAAMQLDVTIIKNSVRKSF